MSKYFCQFLRLDLWVKVEVGDQGKWTGVKTLTLNFTVNERRIHPGTRSSITVFHLKLSSDDRMFLLKPFHQMPGVPAETGNDSSRNLNVAGIMI